LLLLLLLLLLEGDEEPGAGAGVGAGADLTLRTVTWALTPHGRHTGPKKSTAPSRTCEIR